MEEAYLNMHYLCPAFSMPAEAFPNLKKLISEVDYGPITSQPVSPSLSFCSAPLDVDQSVICFSFGLATLAQTQRKVAASF
ncbi:hypothetical protein HDV00_002005 [Rhizophlyctis rosea]|nr:hypothetical protein HDV00_002005 [Rhizophlyctis rosea]